MFLVVIHHSILLDHLSETQVFVLCYEMNVYVRDPNVVPFIEWIMQKILPNKFHSKTHLSSFAFNPGWESCGVSLVFYSFVVLCVFKQCFYVLYIRVHAGSVGPWPEGSQPFDSSLLKTAKSVCVWRGRCETPWLDTESICLLLAAFRTPSVQFPNFVLQKCKKTAFKLWLINPGPLQPSSPSPSLMCFFPCCIRFPWPSLTPLPVPLGFLRKAWTVSVPNTKIGIHQLAESNCCGSLPTLLWLCSPAQWCVTCGTSSS